MDMRITVNHEYYKNPVLAAQGNTGKGNKKSILLTDYSDVLQAVNKGTLVVDGVTLELSDEVRNAIKSASDQRYADSETVNEMNAAIHNANVARQQGDAYKGAFDIEAKALEIARRISKGGKVPPQDEKLLMEYSSDLYQMAKQAAILAKEHEKYDTLVEEESDKPKRYDADEGTDQTRYQVQVDISMGESPEVESVSEVAVK